MASPRRGTVRNCLNSIASYVTSQVRLPVMRKQQQAPGELEQVRAFVNTADLEQGEEQLGSAAELARWLVDHELASAGLRAARADLEHAVGLREALRQILLAHNVGDPAPAQASRTLDDAVC